MADARYNRWQAAAIGQLTVVVALISSLSVGGLGLGVSLLKEKDFAINQPYGWFLAISMLLLFLTVILATLTVVSRLLDFRLTARKVRKTANPSDTRSLTMFCLDADTLSKLTWRLFWTSFAFFACGAVLLGVAISSLYAARLI